MSAAKAKTDPRGLKRICGDCGTKFYDMNNRPITCPSCQTEFTGEIKLKGRRGRVAVAAESQVAEKTAKKATADESEDETEEPAAEVAEVSLDDVQTAEDDKDSVDGDDAAIDLGDDDLDDGAGKADDMSVLDNSDDNSEDDIKMDVVITSDKDD